MDVIGPTRNRRAKVVFGDIPVSNMIKMFKQGFVQHFHCFRVEKIDGFILIIIQPDKWGQLRTTFN